MRSLNIEFYYRKIRCTIIVYLIFILHIEIFLICFAYYLQMNYGTSGVHDLDKRAFFLIFWSINTLSMFLSQTIFLIVAIKQRFGALNFFLEASTFIQARQIKTASKIHLKLTEAIETMNASYCMMAMIFLAGAFCAFNLFLFTLKSVFSTYETVPVIVFMSKILMNVYSFSLSLVVIVVASKTTQEAKRTTKVIFEIPSDSDGNPHCDGQLQNFVQQISSSTTDFSCGLFAYDWKLCFKVIFKGFRLQSDYES